jgi:hypothetical protein
MAFARNFAQKILTLPWGHFCADWPDSQSTVSMILTRTILQPQGFEIKAPVVFEPLEKTVGGNSLNSPLFSPLARQTKQKAASINLQGHWGLPLF